VLGPLNRLVWWEVPLGYIALRSFLFLQEQIKDIIIRAWLFRRPLSQFDSDRLTHSAAAFSAAVLWRCVIYDLEGSNNVDPLVSGFGQIYLTAKYIYRQIYLTAKYI
jgi:hypothetical protein